MKMNEYQELASRTANNDHEAVIARLQANPQLVGMLNAAMGLAGEAGEVIDELKKVIFHGHEYNEEKFYKENGDLLWYVADFARRQGMPLDDVAVANIEKLRRRYPQGFSEDASINRDKSEI